VSKSGWRFGDVAAPASVESPPTSLFPLDASSSSSSAWPNHNNSQGWTRVLPHGFDTHFPSSSGHSFCEARLGEAERIMWPFIVDSQL
jgi:hypothetical protein